MIKVANLQYGNSLQALESLEYEFLQRVKRYSSPVNKLKEIDVNSFSELSIKEYCIEFFDEIITSKPDKLEKIVEGFEELGWNKKLYDASGTKLNIFGQKIYEAFGYENRFRASKTKGIWFARVLGIKACPYCNAQYTIVTKSKNKERARFHFDHFFSKMKFPYLSISIYNLIPCCSNCNMIKSDRSLTLNAYFHPFHSCLHSRSIFKLDSERTLKYLGFGDLKKKRVKVTLKSKSIEHDTFIDNHNTLYEINEIYENHIDIAEDLIMRAIVQSKTRKREILKIKGLFPDEATYYRYLLGNYPYKEDINQRPFAKYVQDIAKQLKLLKE